jgi:hypothetical protein
VKLCCHHLLVLNKKVSCAQKKKNNLSKIQKCVFDKYPNSQAPEKASFLDGYFFAAPVYRPAKSQTIGKKVRAKARLLTGTKSSS